MFSLQLENENARVVDINDSVNYIVLNVSGLNPPSASIYTSKSPNKKGLKYNGSSLNERNIVIDIKLLGDVERNRNALYEWIDTEQYVKIYYKNGVKNAYCEGYVEDVTIDYFAQSEIVSVAIICPNPYWKDLQDISVDISLLAKQFKFPFAIDSEGVPFSTIRDVNETTIYNSGAETGAKFTIKCNGNVTNLKIYNADDGKQAFKINTTLSADWIVVIDTENNPKTCKAYKPDGTTENLLKYVVDPTWFTLKRGYNSFGYTVESGALNATITVGFTNKYLGV
jgi:hypothetical protein